MTRAGLALVLVAGAGCGRFDPFARRLDDAPTAPPPAACAGPLSSGACSLGAAVELGPDGRSDPFSFVVPDGARSFAVEVVGDDTALYALGELTGPDGADRVALPAATDVPSSMQHAFYDLLVARMPGGLYQTVRLGTFSHTFPYAPGLPFSAGVWTLRVASDTPGTRPLVHVVISPDDGANVLHLNLVTASRMTGGPTAAQLLPGLQAIFAPAGLQVIFDGEAQLANSSLATIGDSFGTLPGPQSQLALLARAGRGVAPSNGLDVLLFDGFTAAPTVTGFSLGLPGPDDPSSYYAGVLVVINADLAKLAHSVAHEVSHYLALQHVLNMDADGNPSPDPIADTDPATPNLMDFTGSNTLTPGQIDALAKSPLLQRQ